MEKKSIEEITAQDSGFYARFLIGRLRHLMFNARQKELAPFRISPRQATILFILQNLGHKPTLAELVGVAPVRLIELTVGGIGVNGAI